MTMPPETSIRNDQVPGEWRSPGKRQGLVVVMPKSCVTVKDGSQRTSKSNVDDHDSDTKEKPKS